MFMLIKYECISMSEINDQKNIHPLANQQIHVSIIDAKFKKYISIIIRNSQGVLIWELISISLPNSMEEKHYKNNYQVIGGEHGQS